MNAPPGTVRPSRGRIAWLVAALVAGALLAASSQSIYRALKRWRARHFASQAERYLADENWRQAFDKAQAAYQLSPNDPRTIRSVARLYSRLSPEKALPFWKRLADLNAISSDDRQELAELELRIGRLDLAGPEIDRLRRESPADSKALQLAAQLAALKGDLAGAVDLARQAFQNKPSDSGAELLLGKLLALSSSPRDQEESQKLLLSAGRGADAASLEALVLASQKPGLPLDQTRWLINRLKTHPLSNIDAKLAALDLECGLSPNARPKLAADFLRDHQPLSPAAQVSAARWLNRHGLDAMTVQVVSPAAALANSDLFLARADALASLGQWSVLRSIFEKEKPPLAPALQELFLARIDKELGDASGADAHWKQVEHSLGDLNPPTLLYAAQYSERERRLDLAAQAYRLLTRTPSMAREAYTSLIRVMEYEKNTAQLRQIMGEMIRQFPDDPAPRNDLAYLNLLMGENVEAAAAASKKLVAQDPYKLAYRTTLALAYLQARQPAKALALYDGISLNWSAVLPGWQAVHAAVCGANGDAYLARALVREIPLDALLREERALIEPYCQTAADGVR